MTIYYTDDVLLRHGVQFLIYSITLERKIASTNYRIISVVKYSEK